MPKRTLSVSASYKEAVSSIEAASLYEAPDNACPVQFVSSGSTLLNCALSDNPFGGWPLGRVINLIGDSSSGKTFLALTTLAEAANNPICDKHKLVFDDIEAANTFNIRKLFGTKAVERIIPPLVKDGVPCYSNTIEEWYGHIMRLIQEGVPFIYIADSLDAMATNEELARAKQYVKMQDVKKKPAKDDDNEDDNEPTVVKGSYKTEKAKLLSEILRVLATELHRTNSIVLIISQVRDNIDPMTSRFNKYVRTGGRALKFYSTVEVWLTHKKNIMHTASKRKVGDESLAKISKNKVTGKQRTAEFPIFYDYGIDDITSCVHYLVEEGVLDMPKQTILASPYFGIDAVRDKLVQHIERSPLHVAKLREMVGQRWQSIEDSLKMDGRKPKYE